MVNRTGCIRGCLSLISFFFLVFILLSSLDLPELNFDLGTTESSDYGIDMDSLTTQKIINASYSWKFVSTNLSRKKYHITFKLLASEVEKAMQLIHRIGRMSVRELGLDERINYRNSEIEAQYVWGRIYTIVYEKSLPQMRTISKGFNKVFRNEHLNSKDKVMFLISFVQNMKYDRPGGDLDLFAPLESIAKRFGDCDTKSILLYSLLERLGIDCAMMWSEKYKHAMLGIHVAANGEFKIANGKKYYFLETTYPGWHIGELPPESNNKRFWIINEIDAIEKSTQSSIPTNEDDPNHDVRPSPAIP